MMAVAPSAPAAPAEGIALPPPPPQISCTANPASVTRGGTVTITSPQVDLSGKLLPLVYGACFLALLWQAFRIMGRGYAWLDTGTHDSLLEAGQFIATLEKRQGLKVACPEELAYRQGWIDAGQLEKLAQPMLKNGYGQYLMKVIQDGAY